MTGIYGITSMTGCCGDSHIVSTDQLEMLTQTLLLTCGTERTRRES